LLASPNCSNPPSNEIDIATLWGRSKAKAEFRRNERADRPRSQHRSFAPIAGLIRIGRSLRAQTASQTTPRPHGCREFNAEAA
jgi:hypothetical protein